MTGQRRRNSNAAKLRRAITRRIFERGIDAALSTPPGPGVRLFGNASGGWMLPPGAVDADATCYCIGTGKDISFERALIAEYHCEVVSLDPSEEAGEYVREAAADLDRFRFVRAALWSADGMLGMYVAEDPGHVSLSAANVQRTRESVRVPCRSLPSLMAEFGHDRVDLLKADLEGAEYRLLDPWRLRDLGVRVLAFDVHPVVAPAAALRFLEGFTPAGYELAGRHGMKLTFQRSAGREARFRRGSARTRSTRRPDKTAPAARPTA